MSKTFGGSEQGIFPPIGKKFLDLHGMDDFMYLNPDFQPEGPQVPGAPGLYFNLEKGGDFSQIMRVLTRLKVGVWQYMGMYRVNRSERPALTKAEWLSQSTKVSTYCLYNSLNKINSDSSGQEDLGRRDQT